MVVKHLKFASLVKSWFFMIRYFYKFFSFQHLLHLLHKIIHLCFLSHCVSLKLLIYSLLVSRLLIFHLVHDFTYNVRHLFQSVFALWILQILVILIIFLLFFQSIFNIFLFCFDRLNSIKALFQIFLDLRLNFFIVILIFLDPLLNVFKSSFHLFSHLFLCFFFPVFVRWSLLLHVFVKFLDQRWLQNCNTALNPCTCAFPFLIRLLLFL